MKFAVSYCAPAKREESLILIGRILPWAILAITTATMRQAADFWAQAHRQGRPTALDLALDGDVILAAQATLLAIQENDSVVIATENPRYLIHFAVAEHWRNIQPPTP
jgi:hypothetical protein